MKLEAGARPPQGNKDEMKLYIRHDTLDDILSVFP